MNNIKMLYYDRSDVSEVTDVDHYWCLLNKGFKF